MQTGMNDRRSNDIESSTSSVSRAAGPLALTTAFMMPTLDVKAQAASSAERRTA